MQQVKFNSMYGPGVEKTGLDYSNRLEPIFTEIAPFAMDNDGNFLNKSSFPLIKETGKVDVFEKIQSYKDDVDIYKILERMAFAGEEPQGMPHTGEIYDYSNIPNNIHDFENYVGDSVERLKDLSPDLARVILAKDSTTAEINAAIKSYCDSKVEKNVEKKVEVKE